MSSNHESPTSKLKIQGTKDGEQESPSFSPSFSSLLFSFNHTAKEARKPEIWAAKHLTQSQSNNTYHHSHTLPKHLMHKSPKVNIRAMN
ncbi:hypothetical protein Dimus_039635 [Dionaea muscipula]